MNFRLDKSALELRQLAHGATKAAPGQRLFSAKTHSDTAVTMTQINSAPAAPANGRDETLESVDIAIIGGGLGGLAVAAGK